MTAAWCGPKPTDAKPLVYHGGWIRANFLLPPCINAGIDTFAASYLEVHHNSGLFLKLFSQLRERDP